MQQEKVELVAFQKDRYFFFAIQRKNCKGFNMNLRKTQDWIGEVENYQK